MKKILLAATALVALTGAASAADLPSRKSVVAPVVYAPAFTWTGFYVGLNAGYGWTSSGNSYTARNTLTGALVALPNGSNRGGFVGGGQAGYNWQTGSLVLGAETDIQYADLGRNKNNNFAIAPGVFLGGGNSGNYFGTVRARAGVAFDRALLYVTGGLAYGDVGGSSFSGNSTKVGYTVGAGLEYAFTNNLSAKVEGLYVNIDRGNGNGVILGTPWVVTGKNNNDFGVVRAGLNYRFGL